MESLHMNRIFYRHITLHVGKAMTKKERLDAPMFMDWRKWDKYKYVVRHPE